MLCLPHREFVVASSRPKTKTPAVSIQNKIKNAREGSGSQTRFFRSRYFEVLSYIIRRHPAVATCVLARSQLLLGSSHRSRNYQVDKQPRNLPHLNYEVLRRNQTLLLHSPPRASTFWSAGHQHCSRNHHRLPWTTRGPGGWRRGGEYSLGCLNHTFDLGLTST